MCHAAAKRNRRLPWQVFAVMTKAVAHDRANTLLSLLGIEITHPLAQAGAVKTRRRQHLGSSKESLLGELLRGWTLHHGLVVLT
jgi:hypothetical protein